MAKKFEEKFEKLCAQNDVGGYTGEGGIVDEPTIEDKRIFAKGLYKNCVQRLKDEIDGIELTLHGKGESLSGREIL